MLIPGHEFNPIKIGYSVDPSQRLKEFTRMPFPLEWLGQWDAPNGIADESAAHMRLAKFRLCGEWFFPSRQVIQFVYRKVGETQPQIVSLRKVLKYEERYFDILSSLEKPAPKHALLPDLFDMSSYTTPGPSAVELLAEKWPQSCNQPCHVPLEMAAELSGLEADYIAKHARTWVQIQQTKRYGLEDVGALL